MAEEKEYKYTLNAGNHRHNGKRYHKGDIIELTPTQANKIIHRLEPVDEIPEEADEDKREEMKLKMIHKGAGRYIVINELTGDPIHDGKVSKAEAQEMLDGLIPESEVEVDPESEIDKAEDDEWDDEDDN